MEQRNPCSRLGILIILRCLLQIQFGGCVDMTKKHFRLCAPFHGRMQKKNIVASSTWKLCITWFEATSQALWCEIIFQDL
ncbi:hypothetical protein V2J09_016240 [Rumex salicifolius]